MDSPIARVLCGRWGDGRIAWPLPNGGPLIRRNLIRLNNLHIAAGLLPRPLSLRFHTPAVGRIIARILGLGAQLPIRFLGAPVRALLFLRVQSSMRISCWQASTRALFP